MLTRADAPGAIECFTHCLEKRQDWAEAHINIALAYKQSGDQVQTGTGFPR